MLKTINQADEVSVTFAKRLVDTAEQLGCPVSSVLEELGVQRTFFENSKNQITTQLQTDLISAVVNAVEKPGLGIHLGSTVSILDWGVLGYAFISSKNMRRAFETLSTYQRLNGPLVNVYIREEAGEGIISSMEAFPLGELHQFAIEDWLSETRAFFDHFDVAQIEFTKVMITYPEPEHAQLYRDLYDCPVLFDQPANEIHFPAKFLKMPFNMADENVAEMCIRQCATILEHLSEEDPVVDAVRRILITRPNIAPTLEIVSTHLNMSARTLRRRLQEAGTSYKNILSEVRLGMAAEYLRSSQMAPKEIAYLMSYSCVSSFHRAFKQRYAMTPSEYRNQAAEIG